MMLPEEGVWVGMRGGLAGGGLNRGCLSEHGCSSSGLRAGSPPPQPLGLLRGAPGPLAPLSPWPSLLASCSSLYFLLFKTDLKAMPCKVLCSVYFGNDL